MANNLKLELRSRVDKNGAKYFLAKLKGPFSIDATDGIVFLVYTSDQGQEELQIAAFDEKDGS